MLIVLQSFDRWVSGHYRSFKKGDKLVVGQNLTQAEFDALKGLSWAVSYGAAVTPMQSGDAQILPDIG